MSKEKDFNNQPEDHKSDTPSTDAEHQPSQPNHVPAEESADDDFMKPFLEPENKQSADPSEPVREKNAGPVSEDIEQPDDPPLSEEDVEDQQVASAPLPQRTDAPSEEDEEVAEEEDEEKRKDRKREKTGRIRMIPIWVRLVFIIAAIIGSLALGAMIGYGIVGEGGNPMDVFNPQTWYHIYDIIFEGTDRQR